jgi:radical SAM protein with 4Fe4S-binding SPASM domain
MRPRITYLKYLYYLTCCGSSKKLGNYLLNRFEKKARRSFLKSRPVNILIEPCNICNLKCPGCITGTKHKEAINPQVLDLDRFRQIFDQVREYAFNISLYNWGEPFLNKNIFSIIEYASSSGCATTVHSNFNVFDYSMAEEAVSSGLTHIYLSIDGATQQTYEKYRSGGELARVIENVKLIVSKKESMKRRFPILTWKYLVFPHNVHEIESARQKAKELRVDAFELVRGNIDNVAVFGREETHDLSTGQIMTHQPDFCDSLWDSLIVYPDGSVIPCCQAFRKKDIFGNVLENSVEEVWNNSDFVAMRKIIGGKRIDGVVRQPCCECNITEKLRKAQQNAMRRCA